MRQLTPSNLLVGQFAYSPDGSKIAIRTYDNGTLTIVNADGTPLLTPDTGSLFWGMSWSPDSTRLVYLTNPDRAWNELRVVDTRTGAVTPALALIRNGEGVVQPVWRPTGE
jgi:Tol biopolymer transport system component